MTAESRPEQGHSYNLFSGAEFYEQVDGFAIDQIQGQKKKIVNVGSGDGENLERGIEHGKFVLDVQALAFDIDRLGLVYTKRRLSNVNDGQDYTSQVTLIEGTADTFKDEKGVEKFPNFPIKDGWADLVIGLNFIHLLDNPEYAIGEMYRVLEDEGQLVLSSTYEYDRARVRHAETNLLLGEIIVQTRATLKELGYGRIAKPLDFARHKESEYEEMVKKAGFEDIDIKNYETEMGPNDLRGIFSYDDFLQGSFPGVEPAITRPIVSGEIDGAGNIIKEGVIDEVFRKRSNNKVKRDWMILTARKPATSK